MAYAYDAIDNLLGPQAAQKQDIFQQAPTAPVGSDASAAGAQNGVKTDTQSDIGGSSSGSNSSPASSSSAPPVTDTGASDRAAAQANAGKTARPTALNSVQTQLADRSSDLQKEADSYVTTQKAKQSYTVTPDDEEAAIKGDKDKFSAITGLLGRQNINTVDTFAPKTNTQVEDAGVLSNDAGLRQLVSRGQKPTYTAGQAAFDVSALRHTAGFDSEVQKLRDTQSALSKQAQDFQTSKPQEINDYGATALKTAQDNAKAYLTQQSSAIDTGNQAEADARNKLLGTYRAGATPGGHDAVVKGKQDLANFYGESDPRSARFVQDAGVDPAFYAKVHGDYGRDDFVSNDEAARFNSIMGLLGQGDTRAVSNPLGEDYSYDQDALESGLRSEVARLRGEADTSGASEFDSILKTAGDTAAQRNADYSAKYSALPTGDALNQQYLAQEAPTYAGNQYYRPDLVDISQYIKGPAGAPGTVGVNDVLSKDQADRLNYLNSDLGRVADPYSAGNLPDYNPSTSFDKTSYESAVNQMLAQLAQDNAPKPQAPEPTFQQKSLSGLENTGTNIAKATQNVTVPLQKDFETAYGYGQSAGDRAKALLGIQTAPLKAATETLQIPAQIGSAITSGLGSFLSGGSGGASEAELANYYRTSQWDKGQSVIPSTSLGRSKINPTDLITAINTRIQAGQPVPQSDWNYASQFTYSPKANAFTPKAASVKLLPQPGQTFRNWNSAGR